MHTDWKNKDSKDYAEKLIKVFGKPDDASKSCLKWYKKENFDEIKIRDESVPHNFPVKHRDYVYSTKKIKVPPKFATLFATVTGSILIDGLKGEVTARCGALIKNAVTLGFVQDVIAGKVSSDPKKAKSEYGKRIMGNKIPSWYKDTMKEKSTKAM